MQIKRLDATTAQRWDRYVDRTAGATFFHRAGWKEVIERAFGHKTYFLYAERNGDIRGILPLGHINSLFFGNALISAPFCVYGGVVCDDEEVKSRLIEEAQDLARTLNVDYLEMRNLQPHCAGWVRKELYVTFRKAIDPDVDTNMKNIPRKQRAVVRKGIEAGLQGEIDANVERFYEAYAHSVHALGTPVFSKKYFRLLKEVFGEQCEILTVTKDSRLISSVMSFYFKDEVLPYYGGGTREARDVKGNDFMYWDLMRRACEKGVKVFDYGRSKIDTGSYNFKKNWGFEPAPLYYEYHLVNAKAIPDVNPLNPKYQMFIKLWTKLPFAVTKLVGPRIVMNLG